jgi:hypothetical protein
MFSTPVAAFEQQAFTAGVTSGGGTGLLWKFKAKKSQKASYSASLTYNSKFKRFKNSVSILFTTPIAYVFSPIYTQSIFLKI